VKAIHSTTALQRRRSPLLSELEGIYEALSDDALISRLQEYRWTGRPGHSVRALWRAYLASFVLNMPSTNALIRRLEEDAGLRALCGFDELPSRWTFGRFIVRLGAHVDLVEQVFNGLTQEVRQHLHGAFGDTMAIDSSVIRTYSNPDRKRVSDPEASWTVKEHDGQGRAKWYFGYKLHISVDADTELPVAAIITTAKTHDTTQLLPLLAKARQDSGLTPRWVLADAGYDSNANVEGVAHEYAARPIIKRRVGRKSSIWHEGTKRPLRLRINVKSDEWKAAYRRRQSVERVFSKLKEHRSLGKHTRRGLQRVTLLCLSSLIVVQATAVARLRTGDIDGLRTCTRRVA
jgi:IS5 family transposase